MKQKKYIKKKKLRKSRVKFLGVIGDSILYLVILGGLVVLGFYFAGSAVPQRQTDGENQAVVTLLPQKEEGSKPNMQLNYFTGITGVPTKPPAAAGSGGCGGITGGEPSTAQMMATYGNNQSEVEANLVSIPFQGKQIRVHRLVQKAFENVDKEITAANTGYNFRSIGTFNWRQKVGGGSGLSTHSFGTTMDINPDTNPYTTADTHDIPQVVADIFKANGFAWGGDWRPKKDWMHFQYQGAPCPA